MDIFKKAINDIESKQNLNNFIDGLSQYADICTMIAKGQKAYFEELVKEGFTEEQSLRIVIEHGVFPGRLDRDQGNEDK